MSGAEGSVRPLGVALTPMETRREVALHVAARAEELGYSGFYLAEGWGFDASVVLAEIASRTERIALGTGIVNVWGRSAGTLAMLAATLSAASNGRFRLGLGSGSPALAEGLHDAEFCKPVARLESTARQVRRLLDGERLQPSAPRASAPLRLAVRPAEQVPIGLAGIGPIATRVAGEVADAWLPFFLPRSSFRRYVDVLSATADGVGRHRPRVQPGLPVAVAAEPERAQEMATWWVVFYLTSMGTLYAATLERLGFGSAVAAVRSANQERGELVLPPEAEPLLDELLVWGSPATASQLLADWYAVGAEEPSLVLAPGRSVDELDYILEQLAPA